MMTVLVAGNPLIIPLEFSALTVKNSTVFSTALSWKIVMFTHSEGVEVAGLNVSSLVTLSKSLPAVDLRSKVSNGMCSDF